MGERERDIEREVGRDDLKLYGRMWNSNFARSPSRDLCDSFSPECESVF